MNIAVVLPFLLGNTATSGGEVSALGFLKDVASRHKVHIIALDDGMDTEESERAVRDMTEWATSIRVVHLPATIARRLAAKLLPLLFVPNLAAWCSSGVFRQACRETLARYPIDIAVIEFVQMAQYVEEFKSILTVMNVEDALSVSEFRNYAAAESLSLFARFRAAWRWLSWVRYERRYYKMFDHIFVVSEQDNYGLRVFNPGLKITVLPRMMPLMASAAVSDNPVYQIGFIGSFSHRPNVVALHFFFEEVLPKLLPQIPETRVLIAGKNPPRGLIDNAPACVKFAGFVPSIEDFYRQIGIIVAPLITGGGIKIKVIEGLLSGLPVVTTSIGAEGIGLTDGLNALIADAPDDFVAAIVGLVHDRAYRTAIGSAGREHAMSLSSSEQHSQLVDKVFMSLKEAL